MDLHVLGCPEHDLIISRKYFLSVRDKNFVSSIAQELKQRVSGNFIFSDILTRIDVCHLLMKIAQLVAL